ncbi:unnamed protein product [Linum tenue]|uniref:Uncharacterized protein n=1 Tax=Linum tenue TaxID=586396 RepID=A0AAV0L161_9ROSI|nr:unnamed protein product [Linum tenue]
METRKRKRDSSDGEQGEPPTVDDDGDEGKLGKGKGSDMDGGQGERAKKQQKGKSKVATAGRYELCRGDSDDKQRKFGGAHVEFDSENRLVVIDEFWKGRGECQEEEVEDEEVVAF